MWMGALCGWGSHVPYVDVTQNRENRQRQRVKACIVLAGAAVRPSAAENVKFCGITLHNVCPQIKLLGTERRGGAAIFFSRIWQNSLVPSLAVKGCHMGRM